jgi:hypothetical protein
MSEDLEGATPHTHPTKPTNSHELMTDNPHTELVQLQSEAPKTHALLTAIIVGKQHLKRRRQHGGQHDEHWNEYLAALEEWQTVVSDAYFHDRRADDPTVERVSTDDDD